VPLGRTEAKRSVGLFFGMDEMKASRLEKRKRRYELRGEKLTARPPVEKKIREQNETIPCLGGGESEGKNGATFCYEEERPPPTQYGLIWRCIRENLEPRTGEEKKKAVRKSPKC